MVLWMNQCEKRLITSMWKNKTPQWTMSYLALIHVPIQQAISSRNGISACLHDIMANKNRTPYLDGALSIIKGAVCLVTGLPTGRTTKSVKFQVSVLPFQPISPNQRLYDVRRKTTTPRSLSDHLLLLYQNHKSKKLRMLLKRR